MARILSVVDSGPLLAAVDAADPRHEVSLAALERGDLQLVIPAMVVAEATYFVGNRLGRIAEAQFLAELGNFDIEQPHPEDWERIGALTARYADLGIGGTDASVIALAERLDTPLVITLDHRHFSAVRPRHCEALQLFPALD